MTQTNIVCGKRSDRSVCPLNTIMASLRLVGLQKKQNTKSICQGLKGKTADAFRGLLKHLQV